MSSTNVTGDVPVNLTTSAIERTALSARVFGFCVGLACGLPCVATGAGIALLIAKTFLRWAGL